MCIRRYQGSQYEKNAVKMRDDLNIMSAAMKAYCLASKVMPNVQSVSRKVIDSKALLSKQCIVEHLFYAWQYIS